MFRLSCLYWLCFVFLGNVAQSFWGRLFPNETLVSGFVIEHSSPLPSSGRRNVPPVPQRNGVQELAMCICINCSRVTNCSAYYFVETKHNQPHIAATPTFEPRDGSPTIHVNVRTDRSSASDEMDRMWREHAGETARAKEHAMGRDDVQLHGETIYNLTPVTTLEYDVVACADYLEDMGCWVRNMPEEIKRANPHFVPT